jgi:hypothetical protein
MQKIITENEVFLLAKKNKENKWQFKPCFLLVLKAFSGATWGLRRLIIR